MKSRTAGSPQATFWTKRCAKKNVVFFERLFKSVSNILLHHAVWKRRQQQLGSDKVSKDFYLINDASCSLQTWTVADRGPLAPPSAPGPPTDPRTLSKLQNHKTHRKSSTPRNRTRIESILERFSLIQNVLSLVFPGRCSVWMVGLNAAFCFENPPWTDAMTSELLLVVLMCNLPADTEVCIDTEFKQKLAGTVGVASGKVLDFWRGGKQARLLEYSSIYKIYLWVPVCGG